MATRRKLPRKYKTGGAVLDDILPGFGREEPDDVSAAATADEPAPPPMRSETGDAVMQALAAQRRAEELQRAAAIEQAAQHHQQQHQPAPPPQAQPMTIEQQIDAAPWPQWRKDFLRQYPGLLAPENRDYVEFYASQAVHSGIDQNSPDFDRYILDHVIEEKQAVARSQEQAARSRHREQPEAAQASPEPPQSQREAFQEPPPEPRRPPPSEPRRSMPMTAPVSRSEAPSYSGKRTSSSNTLRLTEEERKIARDSIPDRPDAPKYTDAQKEYLYATNRDKYRRMVADGTYSEQRDR